MLDGMYTVFGELVEGYDVLDRITRVLTPSRAGQRGNPNGDRPMLDITMEVRPLTDYAKVAPHLPRRQLTEQEQIRRKSREALEDSGCQSLSIRVAGQLIMWFPYWKNLMRRLLEESVSMAGRLMSRRIMGKASFFDFQDATGRMQAYVRRDDLPEGFYNKVFKRHIDIGDIVGIEGKVFRTRMGEITVHVSKLELLAKALRPLPIIKEQEGVVFNEVTEKEFRYRRRYVDSGH